jgi:hypothetical protein
MTTPVLSRRMGRPPTLRTAKTKGGVARKRATITFPPKVWARLTRQAGKDGRTVSWIVVAAVERYLDEPGE